MAKGPKPTRSQCRIVSHQNRFPLTPESARRPFWVSLRTFGQRCSLCPRRLGEIPQQVIRRPTILELREETMKIRLLLTVAGLAMSFALPAFAQEKETVDPQIRQQLEALCKKFDEASNKADAAALAALFTQDAVEVSPDGLVYGRQALEKKYGDMFQKFHPTDHLNTIERVYMLGKDTCMIIKWSWGEKGATSQRSMFTRATTGCFASRPLA
jgi:uncharacterized protein (TIGR02246 family)